MRKCLSRSLRRLSALAVVLAFLPGAALGQQAILQGGATTQGHTAAYATGGTGQPIAIDAGPAGGTTIGQGISELNITARCTAPPCAGGGTGPDGTIFTVNDAVSSNATGYHALSFSANALGGGLIEYGAYGTASNLPFQFKVNNTVYAFPFVTGGIVGPSTTVVGHLATWNNTTGTLLADGGVALTIGGSSGQIQYNNSGVLGGFTVSGDGTLVASTGVLTVSKIGGVAVSLGGALTTGGAFSTSGASALTLTTSGVTNVSLPASGTLATLAGSEALTNKTYNGNTWTAGTGTLTIAAAKVLTASNTLTFAGTDTSTLNIGGGGALGSAAFTASTAYAPSGVPTSNYLSGDVNLSNTGTYFDGPSIAQGSTGTWYACGTVTLTDSTGSVIQYNLKLWDGTSVISTGRTASQGSSQPVTATLCGGIVSPAGNIRISVNDVTSTSGKILFNASGLSKDSGISAFRVQ